MPRPSPTPEARPRRAPLRGGGPGAAPGGLPWMNLLGVRVAGVDLETAVGELLDAVRSGRAGYVCVRDAHGLVRCQQDPALRDVHNRALMVTPDGMPLVWALKAAGHRGAGRVYGPDLMAAMFDRGQQAGLRHFLYGTTPATLRKLEARLTARFPAARIVGSHSPPFRSLTAEERQEVADRINGSGADIVWVGLSTPKQEHWMAGMRDSLAPPLLVGVGAAFDFHAGQMRQAPRFIQRSGFEWLFRLGAEPRRLWRRYAVTVPAFIGLLLAQATGLRSFPLDPTSQHPAAEAGAPLSDPARAERPL